MTPENRPPLAATPAPPYTAVVFTSVRAGEDPEYDRTARRMDALAAQQPGYLGAESAHEDLGITVSYWVDERAAAAWKGVAEHVVAQERGRDRWYADYRVRVCTVTRDYGPPHRVVTVRPEREADVAAVHAVTAAAFTGAAHSAPPVEPGGPPGEATLVDLLRVDAGWIPDLALVAEDDGAVVGHAVATRGDVAGHPALGVGPVSVRPDRQGNGIGSRLVRALLDAAEQRGESLVVLVGDPGYYRRFGFRPARELGVEAPDPAWGDHFQALALPAHDPAVTGRFTYAAPFSDL